MQQVKKFDGEIIIDVKQLNTITVATTIKGKVTKRKETYTSQKNWHLKNIDELSVNKLVGTVTAAIWKYLEFQKIAKVKDFKSNNPLLIRITDGQGRVIADSVKMEQKLALSIVPRSKDQLGRALYAGIASMKTKNQLCDFTSFIDKADTKYMALVVSNDGILAKKEKVMPVVEISPVEPVITSE